MDKKELVEKIESLPSLTSITSIRPYVDKKVVLGLISQLDEPEKVVIPQFVADWYEENKDDFEFNVWDWIAFRNEPEKLENKEFNYWINDGEGNPIQTLVNMHQFGYTVEKEKRYTIRFKNIRKETRYLKYDRVVENWYFGVEQCSKETKISHTRKELEGAGFGWVFDCEGIEVEEVEE